MIESCAGAPGEFAFLMAIFAHKNSLSLFGHANPNLFPAPLTQLFCFYLSISASFFSIIVLNEGKGCAPFSSSGSEPSLLSTIIKEGVS